MSTFPIVFNNSTKSLLMFISGLLPLALGIMTIWGGISVVYIGAICMLITIPIVRYFEKSYNINGLVLGYTVAVVYKAYFLLLKIIVLINNPMSAIIINDSTRYISNSFSSNIAGLVRVYGVDIGYVYFLKYLVNFFNITEELIPLVFVIPNLFAGSMIAVFVCVLACKMMPSVKPSLIFWIAALDPMLANYSTVVLKDVLVAVFVSVSFIVFLKTKRKLSYLYQTITWALATLFSFLLRWRSSGIITSFITLRVLFTKGISYNKKLLAIAVFFLYITASYIGGGNVNLLKSANKGKAIINTESALSDRINEIGEQDIRRSGRLGYRINNIQSFPLRVATRSIMSFLAPIPPVQSYQFSWGNGPNSRQARLFKDLGGISWYLMMPFLLLGAIKLYRANEYFFILTFGVVIISMGLVGWVDARVRLMGIIPAYILVAKGLTEYRFVNRYSLTFFFLLFYGFIFYEYFY